MEQCAAGRVLVTHSYGFTVFGSDLKPIFEKESKERLVQSAALSADGRNLFTGCAETLTLWDVEKGQALKTVKRKKKWEVRDLSWGPNGWIAVATDNQVEFLEAKAYTATEAQPQPKVDVEVRQGARNIVEIRGPKGKVPLRFVVVSSEKEEESKHERRSVELRAKTAGRQEHRYQARPRRDRGGDSQGLA